MKLKVVFGSALVGIAVLAMACSSTTTPAPVPAKTPAPAAASITVTLTETPYAFVPKDITVEAGKNVVKLTSLKEIHSFTIVDLKIDQIVQPGKSVNITIPTDKKGTFKLICTPHESVGMIGTVTVK